MLESHKKKTNIGVGLGIAIQLAGRALLASESTSLGALVFIVGLAVFLWGCAMYAEGKGYDSQWGFLGLLSIVGLLILVAMQDKHPEAKPGARAASTPPPPPPPSEARN